MRAIILAAGKGTRLGQYGEDLPKCMLSFHEKSILEWQIDVLRSAGVTDIVVVKGYHADKINIPNIRYYNNPHYNTTNMVETLFCAEEELCDDVLVCYSDILYEKNIIQTALKSSAAIGVVVDKDYLSYWNARGTAITDDMETMIVSENGAITSLGEATTDISKAKFRYVGILRFSKAGIEIVKKVYHTQREKHASSNTPWLGSPSFQKAYMTSLLQAVINGGYPVYPIYTKKGWIEFDTSIDYELYNKWLNEGTLERFFSFSK